MAIKIFYSWQSDLPDETNNSFIQNALEKVAELINATVESADRVEIDTATKNAKGTVSISDRILKKIDECNVFVADLSVIGKVNSPDRENNKKRMARRKVPNPNILFELGYAWKKLGEEKIITIMNTAYGKFEDLPFDLRGKTIISYFANKDTDEKGAKEKTLEKNLENAIRLIIEEEPLKENIKTEEQLDEVESFLKDLKNKEEQKKFKKFRDDWFNSKEGLNDVWNAVVNIFKAMDAKYMANHSLYESQDIFLNRGDFFHTLQNTEFACIIEEHNIRSSATLIDKPYRVFLEIRLFKKNGFFKEARYPDDTIEELLLHPDITFAKKVIWRGARDENITLTSEEIVDKAFKLFINQIRNPQPTKGEAEKIARDMIKIAAGGGVRRQE